VKLYNTYLLTSCLQIAVCMGVEEQYVTYKGVAYFELGQSKDFEQLPAPW
jgi:hypothetical protein